MSAAVVVSASYDKQIRLWDAASGRTVKSFTFQESQINSLFLLPDTGYLAVAGFGVVRLYDLATYMSGGGAPAGSNNANQAPSIYSSFESQSSMNFTSLAAVPLLRTLNDDQSSTLSGSSRQLTDSASSVLNDQMLGTTIVSDLGGLLGHGFKEVACLLIATSEDGHIRFLDANSANALRVLKDIATGAAITCSAASPDRKYLLTGNQMGQVSMWHLPSIVASVAMEMKNNRNSKSTPPTADADAEAEKDLVKLAAIEKEKQADKDQQEVLKAFGRYALQEINFANDYSAIRSIAIEPMARWAAVATNAGKVHFIRLARDKSVCGSKAGLASSAVDGVPAMHVAGGTGVNSTGQLTPREQSQRLSISAGGTPQLSPQKSTGNSFVDGASGGMSSRLPLTGRVGSYADGATSSNSYHGPRETIYRSALVANELSANARRNSGASEEGGGGGEVSMNATRVSGSTVHNSIGAVLLDHLEQQNSMNSRSNQATPRQALANAGLQAQLVQQSAAVKLAEELEMEVFDTIQAHYKYILRVLISPNAELLMTCSADYSVGRFIVPAALRLSTSQLAPIDEVEKAAGSKMTSPEVGESGTGALKSTLRHVSSGSGAAGGAEANASETGGEAKVRNETPNPSLAASAQVPPKSSAGEQTSEAAQQQQPEGNGTESAAAATNSADDAVNNTSGKKVKVAAPDSNSANSLGQSFDGTTGRAADDTSVEPLIEFKALKPLTGHHRWVWDGVFSDCSNFLFTASSDNTVRMWNGLTTDRPQSVGFVGHTKPVVAVLLCYDRRRLGTGSPASS
ncbi:hypothetical protein ABB37_02628 [Leptomonas pyrrhocoris]|uniref:Uncharacterized protein n=1 Tax=Leptomonas pyrrhocoris TaxID=157538 RepID=A0A0N0VG99_LEPPY|nr:hypothetical protein ABB37_02628 [Leptomonas pyrrhocoris]XP_015661301.1 hypothetical protein ABB37_02628 [Leptomonas pyrrhocoris]XP_015661302.1 hypothetical protein ABB37_02628 [Leptomonas pyrrhocoris]XP_015661303.1 hypothetical protein ABB37_02628 [Leptomonas pyrrhocoris]KPA82861.1 hypothetical protein ABB37_02628 [Leptomonas pyrrhocoris]KPA82862.1 hypothetical protein ABB37_02628 [Leptomonas pyrrhocoris]KPA82863.1 hypothetical protein ABB37_02628 [Leptomonas pyrrhocoris]KPA82864.1 hypot|eukprot:XP_015661300.1 hypothetical protein ABB37_02628 [Leptomonas pyrrhocoris]